MNNNSYYLKKKDIIVIFVNLLVLSLVLYIYHIVHDLKAMLSNERLCILKTSSETNLNEDDTDNIYFDFSKKDNLKIRHTRSTEFTKCNFIYFFYKHGYCFHIYNLIFLLLVQNMSLFYLAQPNIDFEQNGSLYKNILYKIVIL